MQVFLAVIVGLPLTLLVTAAAFAIGLLGGIPLMLGLRSKHRIVRLSFRLIVDLIRGVPIIVWLFLIYFGIAIGAFRFSSLAAAIVGLGLISCAYLAEIYRGSFTTLPRGQSEAAQALGLGGPTIFRRILAPQALQTAMPSLTTYLLALLKDSSIASTIGVLEMVGAATIYSRQHSGSDGLTPFLTAAGVYIVVSVPLAIVARRLDSKMSRAR
ncbi:amino acid ABC transporter permease [Rathayibacter soli]|uniref:amino acid ABC transporter permease n=1 Tax=Rathayibacter soli TaxID=3144168 RepID=UPI0027E4B7F9|nr:amino acid ABC transporter permease [Glaciibacter superstes]